MSELAAALQIAIKVHADQRDKQGEPYLLHVLRVVDAVSDEAKVVAALHDALEDRPSWQQTDVVLAPLDDPERKALDLLTRKPEQTYTAYIDAIAAEAEEDRFGSIAREVKIADLRDNLGRIPNAAAELGQDEPEQWAALRRRYERALATLEADGERGE